MKYDGKGLVISVGDKLRSNERRDERRELLTVLEVGRDFVWASAPWSNGRLRIKTHRIYPTDGRCRGTGYTIVPLWKPPRPALEAAANAAEPSSAHLSA